MYPSEQNYFQEKFFEPILQKINKQKRMCALAGDFNYDLLNYESHFATSSFYEMLSSHTYRPLILQPSRVTSKSKTLIDNIFINDITSNVIGVYPIPGRVHCYLMLKRDKSAKTIKELGWDSFRQTKFRSFVYVLQNQIKNCA